VGGPEVLPDSFGAKPKVLYRQGNGLGRLEEAADPSQQLHALIVVHEPDIWMVNLFDNTGRHIVDEGPSYVFRAPVLPPDSFEQWKAFEFGCEVAFLKSAGAERLVLSTRGAVRYTLRLGGTEVQLFTDLSDKPLSVDVTTNQLHYSMRYLTYEFVDSSPTLFSMPEGITWTSP
jgi:hypothetical protein